MSTIKEIFDEISGNPEKHLGFIWLVRLRYYKITQAEVAEEAGVDIKTISRIVNDHNRAEQATIDKVEAAIARLVEARNAKK